MKNVGILKKLKKVIIFIISGVAASLEYASGIPVALVLLIRGLRISGGGPLK